MLSRLVQLVETVSGRRRGIHPRSAVHWTCELGQPRPGLIRIGRGSHIGRSTWINAHGGDAPPEGRVVIGEGVMIGRHNVISAKNGVVIGDEVVTAPQVLIMDHAHAYEDPTRPILRQGVTEGGRIEVSRGAWIGFGAVVVCNRGTLRIGENAVIGANSVVTSDVPARSVVVGSPARVVRWFDESVGGWVRATPGRGTCDV